MPTTAVTDTSGTALLAEGEIAAAEAKAKGQPSLPMNSLSTLSQQVVRKGNFKREQKTNNWLKHCWSQVLHVDVENLHPNQGLPVACPCDHLLVPGSTINSIMHLTCSYLGPQNILKMIRD